MAHKIVVSPDFHKKCSSSSYKEESEDKLNTHLSFYHYYYLKSGSEEPSSIVGDEFTVPKQLADSLLNCFERRARHYNNMFAVEFSLYIDYRLAVISNDQTAIQMLEKNFKRRFGISLSEYEYEYEVEIAYDSDISEDKPTFWRKFATELPPSYLPPRRHKSKKPNIWILKDLTKFYEERLRFLKLLTSTYHNIYMNPKKAENSKAERMEDACSKIREAYPNLLTDDDIKWLSDRETNVKEKTCSIKALEWAAKQSGIVPYGDKENLRSKLWEWLEEGRQLLELEKGNIQPTSSEIDESETTTLRKNELPE